MHKFFKCEICGNMAGLIHDSGVRMVCCGQEMTELEANTTDGAQEKHVPFVTVEGDTVKVQIGEVEHPMLPEHYIEWIYLETEQGGQRKALEPGEAPRAEFKLADGDKLIAVYEYCNIHGLWKKEM